MTDCSSDWDKRNHVVIIGAGAAGLMAAGSTENCRVTVLERNEKAGKKLYITGKGRCNVTNDCLPEDFLRNVVRNGKFLYSSIYGFTSADTRDMLAAWGVPTKTERGNRVFPESDKSSDVIRALYARAQANGVQFRWNERVEKIEKTANGFCVQSDCGEYACDCILIATGGRSYPSTGSTGDGYAFARSLGHTVTKTVPSLVPLKTKQDVSALAGVALKNVTVRIRAGNETFSEFGEMLFTHDGVSGPAVLRLSARATHMTMPVTLYIDMKPALDEETLDKRLLSDFSEFSQKQLKNALDKLLPKAMILPVLLQSGLPLEKKVSLITKEERQKLLHTCKNLCYDITGTQSFDTAIVTAGGIAVKEIDPKTMESKIAKGLYFAGEVIDTDAMTGGYNIQIALSTAYAAAKAMSREYEKEKCV
ncbi:MAG: NAD(P)/FAD-dependent oxidoreductase [Clostridia bacterium]|nr:NAD(P)/FAD-dependent oxidoreductase [Clostridia bacterium]